VTKQPRAAIYARVSTQRGQSPDMQIAELKEHCRNRRWENAGEYIDCGVSGASDSRPQLNRLMADANRRRFDVVAVWKFDRFARSVSHLLRALETFRALGIEFVSLSENIDTSTPTGKMVFTVLASVSELERSLIGERVRAGLRNAKAKGTRLGRPALKDLSVTEMQRLRSERRKSRTSYKALAEKYGVSVWTAFQLCKRTKA
jgi:DNA invertase Pin-like site-specific DNA recombinase